MTSKLSYGKTGTLSYNLLQTSRKQCWRFTAHVETCLANNQELKLLQVGKSCSTKKRVVLQFCSH